MDVRCSADGRTLDVRNVIWCTGYDRGLSWIDLPIFDEQRRAAPHKRPRRERAGALLRRPALSARDVVDDDPRRRQGCRTHGGSDQRALRDARGRIAMVATARPRPSAVATARSRPACQEAGTPRSRRLDPAGCGFPAPAPETWPPARRHCRRRRRRTAGRRSSR